MKLKKKIKMEGPLTWGGMLVPGRAGKQLGRKQLCKKGPQEKKNGFEPATCPQSKGSQQHPGLR